MTGTFRVTLEVKVDTRTTISYQKVFDLIEKLIKDSELNERPGLSVEVIGVVKG